MPEFKPYGKTPRWSGLSICITEKLDGTNCGVFVDADNGEIHCQSRNRPIFPDQGNANDNFGFAAWAHANKDRILKLGPGLHFGEWWGQGIGRGYGMTTRVWSLFDAHNGRYNNDSALSVVRTCCGDLRLVPVLPDTDPERALASLMEYGSFAASCDGVKWMWPEGIIINVTLGGQSLRYKYTEHNNRHKWQET